MSKEITEHHNWATALSHCPSFHDVWCIAQWVEMNPASTAGRKFAQLVSSDNLPMGFKGMLQPKMKIQPSFTHTRRDQKRVDFESGLRPEESETIISCPLSCYRQHVDSVLTRSDSLLVLTWLDSNELNSTTTLTQLHVVPFNVHTVKVSGVLWCVMLDPIDWRAGHYSL